MKHQFVFMIHVGEITNLVEHCVASLRRNNQNCSINLFTVPEDTLGLEKITRYGVTLYSVEKTQWDGRRMTCKIEKFCDFVNSKDIPEGSEIIISDTDIVFQDDPFSVFDNKFDIFYTTRGYDYKYTINAGFWGIKKNSNSVSFVDYFVKEINDPSWKEFQDFRAKEQRLEPPAIENYVDWWSDQDFLCVINDKGMPPALNDVSVYDAGNRYNYCPNTDTSLGPQPAINDMANKIGNKEYVVLHFKGRELKAWHNTMVNR